MSSLLYYTHFGPWPECVNNNMLDNIWIVKKINNNVNYRVFKWYEAGILGLGPNGSPYLALDRFFNLSAANEIKKEIDWQFAIRTNNMVAPIHSCFIPSHVNNKKWLTHYVLWSDVYFSREYLDSLATLYDLANAIYTRPFAEPDWSDRIMVKRNPDTLSWTEKNEEGQYAFDVKNKMPALYNFMETELPKVFKSIGRVIIFKNGENTPVGIHRDYPIDPNGHKFHSVCFQFDRVNRPFFIYDEVTKEKVYIKNTRAYFFNDADCHGVDAESYTSYTFRVDGYFHDYISKILGFQNNLAWGPYSSSYAKLNSVKIFEPKFED